MTTAEKAKAYDEALARANELYNRGYTSITGEIFPELAESEDEKIRKNLKHYLEVRRCQTNDDEEYINCNHFLAWLEKQGEQKPQRMVSAEAKEAMYDKPADEIEEAMQEVEEKAKVFSESHKGENSEQILAEMRGEQKPTWSEEDEDNFKHLLDELVCLGNNRNSANRLYYDRLIKFIEELKNRAQPKEKWCDKDERMLDRLIAYFEKQVALTDDDNPRYANWLKSLRPQNTWKPSDEQMQILNKYADQNNHDGYILTLLYNDLKKL